ncbi:MAG: glycosyltransferase family 2 protein [Clostridiales bacterium]|nr:glycosyltransferase family 2 protein [Clostridiales bacterium]
MDNKVSEITPFESIAIVVPSLNPDEKLFQVVRKLVGAGFSRIVVVNDGSDEAHMAPFAQVESLAECHVLTHEVNKGKGRALKTAFAYLLEAYPDIAGVVTVDGDDQHQTVDVAACAEAIGGRPGSLILGVRDFGASNVPLRSRLGNRFTCLIFRVFCGLRITDTQTGLRAIPAKLLDVFRRTDGERFEYETNMLLDAGKNHIPIHEVGISTVYIEGNESSHFRVLQDSWRIYRAILRRRK